QHGGHFERDRAGDDHEIALPRTGTEDLGAEARDIEARGAGGDHLDGAAGQAERKRPDGRLASPVEHVVHAGGDDILLELVLDERGHLKRILSRSRTGRPRYAANPGLTPSFRRSLPET